MTQRPIICWAAMLGVLGGLTGGLSFAVQQSRGQSQSHSHSGGSFTIAAYAYDRGRNVETCTSGYADAEPLVGNLRWPTEIEYDVDFPVAAEYTISIYYAAASARPVGLFLDGEQVGICCRGTTGSWNSSKSDWEEACRVHVPKGSHTVRLYSDNVFPHIVALRFDSAVPFPDGWMLRRPGARGLPGHAVDADPAALRLAVTDLMETYGPRYPHGRRFLQRLAALEGELDALSEDRTDELRSVRGS